MSEVLKIHLVGDLHIRSSYYRIEESVQIVEVFVTDQALMRVPVVEVYDGSNLCRLGQAGIQDGKASVTLEGGPWVRCYVLRFCNGRQLSLFRAEDQDEGWWFSGNEALRRVREQATPGKDENRYRA